jgi:hypothetical protein
MRRASPKARAGEAAARFGSPLAGPFHRPASKQGKALERLTRQFPVRNARGVKLTLLEFQNFREFRTAQGMKLMPGRKRFMLDSGEEVTQADDKQFILASMGEPLSPIT